MNSKTAQGFVVALDCYPLAGGRGCGDAAEMQIRRALFRPWVALGREPGGAALLKRVPSSRPEEICLLPRPDSVHVDEAVAVLRAHLAQRPELTHVAGFAPEEVAQRGGCVVIPTGRRADWTLSMLSELPADGFERPTGPFRATASPLVLESPKSRLRFRVISDPQTLLQAWREGDIDASCPTGLLPQEDISTQLGTRCFPRVFLKLWFNEARVGALADIGWRARIARGIDRNGLPPGLRSLGWYGGGLSEEMPEAGVRSIKVLYGAYYPNRAVARVVAKVVSVASGALVSLEEADLATLGKRFAALDFDLAIVLGTGFGKIEEAYALDAAVTLAAFCGGDVPGDHPHPLPLAAGLRRPVSRARVLRRASDQLLPCVPLARFENRWLARRELRRVGLAADTWIRVEALDEC